MKIIWTRTTKISFAGILDYLNENWTQREIDNFADETRKVILQIQKNPLMYIASSNAKNIRKGFVNKKVSLFYRVQKRRKKITLLMFWDNRQNPKNLKY